MYARHVSSLSPNIDSACWKALRRNATVGSFLIGGRRVHPYVTSYPCAWEGERPLIR